MAGTTNYPGALDTTTNLPIASALVTVELDGDGDANKIHSNLHGVLSQAAVAIEAKIGTGASTPIANRVLRGSGTGTSAWAQVALATDVSGTLAVANTALVAGTGITLSTNTLNVDASQGQITTVGALGAGTIGTGFGTINNGASSITTTGAVATGVLTPSSIAYTGNLYFTGTLTTASNTNNYMVRFNEADSSVTASASNAGTGASGYGFVTIDGEAIAAASSYTFAESSSLMITGAPTAGTNMTLTKAFALNVVAGDVNLAAGSLILANAKGIKLGGLAQWGLSYGTQTAGWITLGDTNTISGFEIYPGSVNETEFHPSGDVVFHATGKLRLDGSSSGNTYIYEESADDLHVVVGGSAYVQIDQDIDAMSFGSSSAPNIQAQTMFDGSWTAGEYGGFGVGIETDITGAAGATALAHMGIRPLGQGSVTTQNGSITYTDISTLKLAEPGITKGGTDTVTVAATLYVANAPTEATTNAAIYVASGDTIVGAANGRVKATHNLLLGADFGNAQADSEIRFEVDGSQVGFIGAGGELSFSGGFSAHSEADNLVIGSTSGRNGMTIVSGTSSGDKASIFFADSGGTAQGFIRYNNNNDSMNISTDGTPAIDISSGQDVDFAGNIRIAGRADNYFSSLRGSHHQNISSATTLDDSAQGMIVVHGEEDGGATGEFMDLVWYSRASTPAVISAYTVAGSPTARTYSRSGNNLQLAMASGTYDVSWMSLNPADPS